MRVEKFGQRAVMSVRVPSAPLQSSRTTLNRDQRGHKLYCMDRLYNIMRNMM